MTAAPGPLGRFVSRLKMKVFIASVLLLVCANLSLQNEAVRNIYHLPSTHTNNPKFHPLENISIGC